MLPLRGSQGGLLITILEQFLNIRKYSFSDIRAFFYYSLDSTGKLLLNRPVRPYLSFGSGTPSLRLNDEGYFNELT